MIIAIQILVILILLTAFLRNKYSAILMLVYQMLVPISQLEIGGITLKINILNGIVLLGFILTNLKRGKEIDVKPFIPFVILYIVLLLLIPFQDRTPFSFAINEWRADTMMTFIIPFILWNYYRWNILSFRLIRNTLIMCVSIGAIYGLILIATPGINPYLMIVLPYGGAEFAENYAAAGYGRLFGRISSVYPHPMTFGLIIVMAIITLFAFRNLKSKIWPIPLIILCSLNAIFCGVRSTIVALFCALVFSMVYMKKFKVALKSCIAVYLFLQVIFLIPSMNDYVMSVVNSDNSKVGGSSLEMRMEQFEGSLKEIQSCKLQGNGYAWNRYYQLKKGDHPVLLAFESLVFVVICNYGIIGVLTWIWLCIRILTKNYGNKNLNVYIKTLFIAYLSYSITTGEYWYMRYFLLFYTMILMTFIKDKRTELVNHKKTI